MAGERVELGEVIDRLDGAVDSLRRGEWPPALARVLPQLAVSAVKDNFAKGTSPDGQPWRPLTWPRPRGGTLPLRDTGGLMASIQARLTPGGIEVGTVKQGAALHQYGGTVVPKTARLLAIPLSKEAVRVAGPRQFPRPLHIERKKGSRSAVLAEEGKGKRQGKAHYALVPRVKVPARPFLGLSKEWQGRLAKVVAEALVKQAAEALRRG